MVTVEQDQVEFRFYRPKAKQVYLAGDFNEWDQVLHPMMRTPEGYWLARMHLPPGEFSFRYCADGEWFSDYAAFGLRPGRFGLDSVVRVLPPAASPARQEPAPAAAAA